MGLPVSVSYTLSHLLLTSMLYSYAWSVSELQRFRVVTNGYYNRPPHQIMAWVGLERYGYIEDAQRLAYRWLYM